MTQVIELSPSAFHDVDEEALRSHFLVQGTIRAKQLARLSTTRARQTFLFALRGATSSPQSASSAGPKKLSETIDQLLGYSSWRDSKTSVVVFNRNRDFSKVLAAIPEAVRAHPQYKKDLPGSTETVFRYLFANRDDRNRELYLTVMAFDVPTPRP
jgi:hypothetical protein